MSTNRNIIKLLLVHLPGAGAPKLKPPVAAGAGVGAPKLNAIVVVRRPLLETKMKYDFAVWVFAYFCRVVSGEEYAHVIT